MEREEEPGAVGEDFEDPGVNRRDFITFAAALAAAGWSAGASSASGQEESAAISARVIAEAEKLAGLKFTDQEREMMVASLGRHVANYERLRAVEIPNSVPPAIQFRPDPPGWVREPRSSEAETPTEPALDQDYAPEPWIGARPSSENEIAFLPVHQLARLIHSEIISPVELTEIYLERLERIGAKLNCVVTLMRDQALAEAREREAELKQGRSRGPLHGIPWGAKDLFSARGARTTWGAKPYEDQVIDDDATVVVRLREAGAVLAAKLSMGALAQGDVWYNGRTNNPWNLERGSSGSSAGPAAATAAGLVGFSIGTETLGSIVSPATICGVTGLRPTFGRISRHGAMALSWSMDKIGPMCRSVEDCALVFAAIHGADGRDPTAVSRPFTWSRGADLSQLRIGFDRNAFEEIKGDKEKALNDATLARLTELGAKLTPIELPDYPLRAIRTVLSVEAAAAFDELTRSDRDDLLRSQSPFSWPNSFRTSRLVPAVEYIQAQRARTLLMREMSDVMADFDLYVTPSRGGASLTLTNLTGHPAVVLPNGFVDGMPRSVTMIGSLFDEARLLAAAEVLQSATDWHTRHPIID